MILVLNQKPLLLQIEDLRRKKLKTTKLLHWHKQINSI